MSRCSSYQSPPWFSRPCTKKNTSSQLRVWSWKRRPFNCNIIHSRVVSRILRPLFNKFDSFGILDLTYEIETRSGCVQLSIHDLLTIMLFLCQVQQVKEAERSGVAAQRLLAVTCDASARLTGALRTGPCTAPSFGHMPQNHTKSLWAWGFLSLLPACRIYWCAASALALGAIIWREWLCHESVGVEIEEYIKL